MLETKAGINLVPRRMYRKAVPRCLSPAPITSEYTFAAKVSAAGRNVDESKCRDTGIMNKISYNVLAQKVAVCGIGTGDALDEDDPDGDPDEDELDLDGGIVDEEEEDDEEDEDDWEDGE